MIENKIKVSVTGLGYVGLPLAIAFAAKKFEVFGYDVNERRVKELTSNYDRTLEVTKSDLNKAKIKFTSDIKTLEAATFHIITVPTPIDEFKKPDLSHVKEASSALGRILKKNDLVVVESTVFPGATEEIVIPILESESNLKVNADFLVGYSPERMNPSDKIHTIEKIKKVVAGSNDTALALMKDVYGSIIKAGIHCAPSIKVAEAAKVIENTQRDLNIALMNELVKIFNALDIDTNQVLEAAETKWNFLRFRPGLVGGHCIGVDPYYLIHKSLQSGIIPDLIMSARKINDGMSSYFAQRILKFLRKKELDINFSKILILGVSFKENCPDIRNSKVIDLVSELESFGANVDIFDPVVDYKEVKQSTRVNIKSEMEIGRYDLIVIAVPHNQFKKIGITRIRNSCKKGGSIMDLKNTFSNKLVDQAV